MPGLKRIGSIVVIVSLLFIGPFFTMRVMGERYIFSNVAVVPQSDIGILLGASVVQGKPSPVLQARAEAAVRLYEAGKIKKILVTGDDEEPDYDEVTPVFRYLIDSGIPQDDIILDHGGLDTYSSMYRARNVFDVSSATIITQDFHMPRALFLARWLGMDAYGLTAAGGDMFTHEYSREIPASVKAAVDLLSKREPRYLEKDISDSDARP